MILNSYTDEQFRTLRVLLDTTEVQGYQNLYSYLDKIGEGAVNSPFQTQDSN